MLAKVLIAWGGTIVALLYLALAISAAADAYVRGGWAGLAVAIIIASAVPALVLGAILQR
jgi:hypothetical protein